MKRNYRSFFVLAIAFFTIGISSKNHAFTGLAAVFFILGMKKRKEEQQNDEPNNNQDEI